MKLRPTLLFLFAAGILMFVFRYEIMYALQKQRLSELQCLSREPKSIDLPLEPQPPCSKFWVHRVNSLQRLERVINDFNGVECDVVFDSSQNKLFVYHPPAGADTTTLEHFLQRLSADNKYLWIDVKSFSDHHLSQLTAHLEALDHKYHFSSKAIIETSSVWLANYLAHKRFRVSFLVPAELLNSGALPADAVLPNESVQFVSQEDVYVNQLKRMFPKKKLLVWSLSIQNFASRTKLKQLANDSAVFAILINIKTRHYR
jgi:hypothetical protein